MNQLYTILTDWYNEVYDDGEILDALLDLPIWPELNSHIRLTDGDELTDNAAIKLYEAEYYLHIQLECNAMQWYRITKQELCEKLRIITGNPFLLLNTVHHDKLVSDYAFIANIFKHCGYIDIYYLIPPVDSEVLLITGITVMQE